MNPNLRNAIPFPLFIFERTCTFREFGSKLILNGTDRFGIRYHGSVAHWIDEFHTQKQTNKQQQKNKRQVGAENYNQQQ